MNVALSDKGRIKAAVTFMEGSLSSFVNEVADFSVTCVATSALDRLRKEVAITGLPTTLHLTDEKARTL
ncbi:hypothetical protein [Ruegeria sp. AU67]|uniref:hypothetical protein n=1 Tax=Ruegeria sp. AU67 TaxID=2108530 RepID=UPI000D698481|nr:hypothetical protein [Ruegeria sp. AU67]